MACEIDHSSLKDILVELPICQGGPGRHKCAGCAYEKGLEDGRNKKMVINMTVILNNLPVSQSGFQRHKDPHVAYIQGYLNGLLATKQ